MMRRLTIFFQMACCVLIAFEFTSCAPKQLMTTHVKNDSAVFKFSSTIKNFGFIKEGYNPSATFEFENIGNAALIINKVETECNCTVAEFSTNPVSPASKGFIKVNFKSASNIGAFNKAITIFSNATEKQKTLSIKGIVISSAK